MWKLESIELGSVTPEGVAGSADGADVRPGAAVALLAVAPAAVALALLGGALHAISEAAAAALDPLRLDVGPELRRRHGRVRRCPDELLETIEGAHDFDAFAHTGGGSAFFRPTPGRVDIALSRGFLDTGQTYTIRAASERTDLVSASSTDYLNVRVAPDGKDHALVDADKGWLRITDLGLDRCYVRVTYKAGFLTDLGCPAIFGEGAGSSTPVPTWLKEAAKLQVLVNLAHHPVVSRDTGRDAREIAEEIKKDREDTLNRILAQRTRAMPMGHGSVLEATVTASAT